MAFPRQGCFKCLNSSWGWDQRKQLKSLVKENTYSCVFILEVKSFLTIELAVPLLSQSLLGGAVGLVGKVEDCRKKPDSILEQRVIRGKAL